MVSELHGQFITSTSPPAGEFSCSNPLFNRTAELIRWAMRSNMVSILTDCPHRERLGWLEQDHLVGPSLMYSFRRSRPLRQGVPTTSATPSSTDGLVPDIAPEYAVFGGGFRDSPEWGSACVLIPWQLYQWYGDPAILREQYPTMKRYVAYLGTKSKDHILSHGLGDWYDLGPNRPGQAQLTPTIADGNGLLLSRHHDPRTRRPACSARPKTPPDIATLANEVRDAFNRSALSRRTRTSTPPAVRRPTPFPWSSGWPRRQTPPPSSRTSCRTSASTTTA